MRRERLALIPIVLIVLLGLYWAWIEFRPETEVRYVPRPLEATYTPYPTPEPLPSLTPWPTHTLRPTYTPLPTFTHVPTATAKPYPTLSSEDVILTYALGPDVAQEQAGVRLRLLRLKLEPLAGFTGTGYQQSLIEIWLDEGVVTLGTLSVSLENTTQDTVRVYPNQGTIVVGDEQVALSEYMFLGSEPGGDFLRGVRVDGDVYFGLRRRHPAEVSNVRYVVNPPSDARYRRLSSDPFDFDLQLD